jgi:GrpB-like predicted nucleotidyltransferase (UPF0157 family)
MPKKLGLEAGKVELEAYSPAWEVLYSIEEQLIQQAFKDTLVCVAHIGSTSIKNMRAKPIIDILLVLSNDFILEEVIQLLAEMGYKHGAFKVEEGHFFIKGNGDVHTHYLHLRKESHGWKKYLTFRDYLRAYPIVASEYESLKDRLREKFHSKREFYTKGKEEFILGILGKFQ